MNNNADDMQRYIKIQIKTIFKESRFLFKFYFFFFQLMKISICINLKSCLICVIIFVKYEKNFMKINKQCLSRRIWSECVKFAMLKSN